MRRRFVAGNWKMNMTPSETTAFLKQLVPLIDGARAETACLVPAIDLIPAMQAVEGSTVRIGAENLFDQEKGAFTGEISPLMLRDIGVKYVIIGHSERRMIFGEDDGMINRKVRSAFAHGLTPILCCGETLETREAGETLAWIEGQIRSAFEGVTAEEAKTIVVAYEPIWAIGTGRTASTAQAEEVCGAIRSLLADLYGTSVSEEIRILYGGSVNATNAAELFAQPDIDGGLVGGASLKLDFEKIVNAE